MAKRFLIVFAAVALVGAAPASRNALDGASAGQRLSLDRVPFNVAAEAILRRVSTRPFLLCDVALADQRPLSLRLDPYQINLAVIGQAFAAYGYRLSDKQGVLYLCDGSDRAPKSAAKPSVSSAVAPEGVGPVHNARQRPEQAYQPSGGDYVEQSRGGGSAGLVSPLMPYSGSVAPLPLVKVQTALVSYRPDYVSPAALLASVQPVFPDVNFSVVAGEGQRPALFASGDVETVERFEQMAKWLDREPQAVEVQAIVLEVSDGSRVGFGVSFVLDALKSGVGVRVDGGREGNELTFRSGSFDAVMSAVSGSSNVRVVSSPRLRGRSGEKLRLQVGADVPTLGAVVENASGSTQQTVQYRRSGVIFEVSAQVFGKRIGIDVHQELSAFASTETGVRGSPTLSTRNLDTSLDLESGEWVVIGGLSSSQDDVQRQSLFGVIPLGKVRDQRRSELVMLLNVRKVERDNSSSAQVREPVAHQMESQQ
jgi:type II secretory pathway component GspD/PulD (secretin)